MGNSFDGFNTTMHDDVHKVIVRSGSQTIVHQKGTGISTKDRYMHNNMKVLVDARQSRGAEYTGIIVILGYLGSVMTARSTLNAEYNTRWGVCASSMVNIAINAHYLPWIGSAGQIVTGLMSFLFVHVQAVTEIIYMWQENIVPSLCYLSYMALAF